MKKKDIIVFNNNISFIDFLNTCDNACITFKSQINDKCNMLNCVHSQAKRQIIKLWFNKTHVKIKALIKIIRPPNTLAQHILL